MALSGKKVRPKVPRFVQSNLGKNTTREEASRLQSLTEPFGFLCACNSTLEAPLFADDRIVNCYLKIEYVVSTFALPIPTSRHATLPTELPALGTSAHVHPNTTPGVPAFGHGQEYRPVQAYAQICSADAMIHVLEFRLHSLQIRGTDR